MANWWDAAPKASPLDVALATENVDPKLADIARSVYTQESGSGKNTKTSNAGAVGGMQIKPGTFSEVADKGWNINDPVQNARAGVRYLAKLYDQAGGDPALTAAGYYGGPGGLEKARKGIAVSDPRNPNAPTTLEYGKQVAGRVLDAVIPSANAATPKQEEWWAAAPVVDTKAATVKTSAEAPKKQESGLVEGATNLVRGVGHGITQDIIGAPAQLVRNLVPESVGRAVDALGNKLADLGLPIARVNGAEDLNRQMREKEAEYQKDTEGSVAAGVGRVGANLASVLGPGGAKAITGGANLGKKIVYNLGGTGATAQRAAGLAGASAGSGALSAGTGALFTPVTEEGDYGQNKLAQIQTTGLVGFGLPAVGAAAGAGGRYVGRAARSFVEPFTEAGQNRIAGNLIRRFGEGGPITGNAAELVPGSIPRLSEVTGNAGLGSLELGFSSANPEMKNAIARQVAQNNAARFAALSNLAGSEADRAAAVQARSAATRPLYDAATAVNVPVDAELNALMRRPSLQSAVGRAENLAAEQGGTFGLSQPQNLASRRVTVTGEVPGQAGSMAGAGAATPAVPPRTFSVSRTVNPRGGVAGEGTGVRRTQEVSGQDLQNLKLAMDAQLLDPTSGIAGREVGAVEDTRNALVNWLRNRIPGFKEADLQYAEMSKPIAQMDIGQRLIDKYTTALERLGGDAPPKIKAEAFAQAVLDERKLLKNSKVHEGYKSLEDVFTPEQLKSLQGLADDLARAAHGTNAGKTVGATTFQNLSTNNILENALPGPVRALVGGRAGPVGTAMGAVGNVFYKGANEKIQNRLMEMLMNPQSGLNALQNVGGNQLTGPLGSNALLQRLAPNLLPAATVSVGGGLARGK